MLPTPSPPLCAAPPKARHVLLGTATPIQTDQLDLWDLIQILASGADHILGNQAGWRPCMIQQKWWKAWPRKTR
jgi:hypothetical protein